MTRRILVVDDDEVGRRLFEEVLESEGHRVDAAASGEEALSRLKNGAYDLLLIDVRMSGITGLEVTRLVHQDYPNLPIVVMTAFGTMETAIEAIREGAFDFVSKPANMEELKKTVARALATPTVRGTKDASAEVIEEDDDISSIIGKSAAMVEVYKTVARAAPTKSTVLIFGESGTGKELIARAIHQHSGRANNPFVEVDCGALTETLLESELFGHVRGAFTGAVNEKPGVFEEASGGTCFLDEIGDISPNMQAKLLRVLQEHELRRVGSTKWTKVDVRVVAATNKNLDEMVKKGLFREDLYYRLKVISIYLPPIRDRREDIPSLAHSFLRRFSRDTGKIVSSISDKAMDLLCDYSWPGNIRELENVIERAVVLSNQSIISEDDLPSEIKEKEVPRSLPEACRNKQFLFPDTPNLEEVKKRYVLHVLASTHDNISWAAKILDIDRRSLYRMLERFKVAPFFKGK